MASERFPSRPACLLVASGAAEGEARAEGDGGGGRGRRPDARPAHSERCHHGWSLVWGPAGRRPWSAARVSVRRDGILGWRPASALRMSTWGRRRAAPRQGPPPAGTGGAGCGEGQWVFSGGGGSRRPGGETAMALGAWAFPNRRVMSLRSSVPTPSACRPGGLQGALPWRGGACAGVEHPFALPCGEGTGRAWRRAHGACRCWH